jgi:hypothetical protein
MIILRSCKLCPIYWYKGAGLLAAAAFCTRPRLPHHIQMLFKHSSALQLYPSGRS